MSFLDRIFPKAQPATHTPEPPPSRMDGLTNAVFGANPFGIGSALSPSATKGAELTYSGGASRLAEYTYSIDGIARGIIDLPIATALSKGIELDDLLKTALKSRKVMGVVKKACTYDRLFGGALVVAYADDGVADMTMPLGKVRGIERLEVFDRYEVMINQSDYNNDPASKNYGNVEFYTLNRMAPNGINYAYGKRVHHTRCFRMTGTEGSYSQMVANSGWGGSALEPVAKSLADYNFSIGAAPSIINDFITTIISMDGLTDRLRDPDGEAAVRLKVSVIDKCRSLIRSIVIDGKDTYAKQASSVAGLAEIYDRLAFNVCANTGIPATLLFGRAPAGMNSTGEGDMNNWHQAVAAYQEDKIGPLLEWIIGLLEQTTDWPNGRPASFEFQWPDLAPMDELKRAQIKLALAQADEIYDRMGAIDGRWVYVQRHGAVYKFDPVYDKEAYEQFLLENDGAVNSGETQTLEPKPGEDPISKG